MELRGFFATVFAILFTVEVYSRPSDPRPLSFSYIKDDGSGCTNNNDRYMKINMDKCENKNSQMECSAMADGETSSDSRTVFTVKRIEKKTCISFQNTYSLMVQGNNAVSFVNVSCEKERENVWFEFMPIHDQLLRRTNYHGFFIRNSTMCLTRLCNGTLSVERVNSTYDRKCFFTRKIIGR